MIIFYIIEHNQCHTVVVVVVVVVVWNGIHTRYHTRVPVPGTGTIPMIS